MRHTEVHVDGTWPLRIGHVLVNRVQYLLLYLGDGVAVQHLDRNLWAVLIVWVHTIQGLDCTEEGEGWLEGGSGNKKERNHRGK